MNSFLTDFFDEFDEVLGFGKPRHLKFNTGNTQDMSPVFWQVLTDDDNKKIGYKSVCRTVGVAPEDVKVVLEDGKITVQGETEFDGSKYNTYYDIPVSDSVVNNIENIKYKTLNCLTYIYIYTKIPQERKVLIEKI